MNKLVLLISLMEIKQKWNKRDPVISLQMYFRKRKTCAKARKHGVFRIYTFNFAFLYFIYTYQFLCANESELPDH